MIVTAILVIIVMKGNGFLIHRTELPFAPHVLMLVQDLDVRIINAATGELIRVLTIDPTRDYQPTGASKGPKRKKFRT
jgi:hypothetical protein